MNELRHTRRISSGLTLLLMLVWSAACGGGAGAGGGEIAPEKLRVMHLAPDAPALDVKFNGMEIITDLRYSQITEYFEVVEEETETTVFRDDEVLPVATETLTFDAGKTNTLYFYEEDDDDEVKLLLVEDIREDPNPGQVRLKIGNLSPNAPSIDLYIVRPGESIRERDPDATVAFKAFSDYFEFNAGDFVVKVTEAGDKDVLVDTGTLTATAGETRTLVMFEKTGGGLPLRFAYLLDEAP